MSGGILTIIDQLNHNNDNTKISAVCIGKQISFFSPNAKYDKDIF